MSGDWRQSSKEISRLTPAVLRWLSPILNFPAEKMVVTGEDSDDDKHFNTDVLAGNIRVALRGRWVIARTVFNPAGYNANKTYFHQFTIRKSRPSKRASEDSKIKAGHGDLMVYFWGDNSKRQRRPKLVMAALIDLGELRRYFNEGLKPFATLPNGDKSSDFDAYDLRKVPRAVRATWINLSYAKKHDLVWRHKQLVSTIAAKKRGV